jgi:hypothetical protein
MNRLIITLATALLPPSRSAWGQAMKAEFDALPEGRTVFALGCLGASLRENVTTGEGWARMGLGTMMVFLAGLLVIQVNWLGDVIAFNKVADWPHLFTKISWFVAPIWALCTTVVAMVTISQSCCKPIDLSTASKLGAVLFALVLIGTCGERLLGTMTSIGYETSKFHAINWAKMLKDAPVIVISLAVAAFGFKGTKQLAIATASACFLIISFGIETPVIEGVTYVGAEVTDTIKTVEHPLSLNLFIFGFLYAVLLEVVQRMLSQKQPA